MKITSFKPIIITRDMDAVTRVFEDLGFETRHQPSGTSAIGNQYTSYRMTDSNGFHVDVSTTTAAQEQDVTAIRMNVDDFEEAYDFLIAHGFQNAQKGTVTDTGAAKVCFLYSPSGFGINLIQHIKK